MQIRKSSFSYKLIKYTFGDLPEKSVMFILCFIFAILMLPLSHSLYLVLYLTKSKYIGEWNDVKNGFFLGSSLTIGILILGGIVCTITLDPFPMSMFLKLSILYGVGFVTTVILGYIFKYINKKISKIKFEKVDYLND
jgi:ABC-type multidrug transport system fused ATPase/permease subunit